MSENITEYRELFERNKNFKLEIARLIKDSDFDFTKVVVGIYIYKFTPEPYFFFTIGADEKEERSELYPPEFEFGFYNTCEDNNYTFKYKECVHKINDFELNIKIGKSALSFLMDDVLKLHVDKYNILKLVEPSNTQLIKLQDIEEKIGYHYLHIYELIYNNA